MKNLLSILFLFIATTAFGQLQKGNLLTGGSADINITKSTNATDYVQHSKYRSININPRIGLFLSDKSALGLELGYSNSRNEELYYDDPKNYISTTITGSVNIFYRHYFPLNEKVALFLHGSIGALKGMGKNPYSPTIRKTDIRSENASINPGVAFFITPKLSIEATLLLLAYQIGQQKTEGENRVKLQTLNFQYFPSSIGLSWYISR